LEASRGLTCTASVRPESDRDYTFTYTLPVPKSGPTKLRVQIEKTKSGKRTIVTDVWVPIGGPVGEAACREYYRNDSTTTETYLDITNNCTESPGATGPDSRGNKWALRHHETTVPSKLGGFNISTLLTCK
jgi:hypothetical protein